MSLHPFYRTAFVCILSLVIFFPGSRKLLSQDSSRPIRWQSNWVKIYSSDGEPLGNSYQQTSFPPSSNLYGLNSYAPNSYLPQTVPYRPNVVVQNPYTLTQPQIVQPQVVQQRIVYPQPQYVPQTIIVQNPVQSNQSQIGNRLQIPQQSVVQQPGNTNSAFQPSPMNQVPMKQVPLETQNRSQQPLVQNNPQNNTNPYYTVNPPVRGTLPGWSRTNDTIWRVPQSSTNWNPLASNQPPVQTQPNNPVFSNNPVNPIHTNQQPRMVANAPRNQIVPPANQANPALNNAIPGNPTLITNDASNPSTNQGALAQNQPNPLLNQVPDENQPPVNSTNPPQNQPVVQNNANPKPFEDDTVFVASSQKWYEYDIRSYTGRFQNPEEAQKAIRDWILRVTSPETWHDNEVAAFTIDREKVKLYHNPEVRQQMDNLLGRFVHYNPGTFHCRIWVLNVEDLSWRRDFLATLKPLPVKEPGRQAWLVPEIQVAQLLTQVKQAKQSVGLTNPRFVVENGTTSIVNWQPKKVGTYEHIASIESEGDVSTQTELANDGIEMVFSPLITIDGNIEMDLEVMLRKQDRTRTIKVDTVGKPRVQIPEIHSAMLKERFVFEPGQNLLLSFGLGPSLDDQRGLLRRHPLSEALILFEIVPDPGNLAAGKPIHQRNNSIRSVAKQPNQPGYDPTNPLPVDASKTAEFVQSKPRGLFNRIKAAVGKPLFGGSKRNKSGSNIQRTGFGDRNGYSF